MGRQHGPGKRHGEVPVVTEFVEVPLLPQSDSSNGGKFTYSTASTLQSKLSAEATRFEGQAGSRASYVATVQQDFDGHFSELFATNATTAAQDASNLASALRTVAGYVGKMISAGHEEDARRKENNEWVHRHNNKDFGNASADTAVMGRSMDYRVHPYGAAHGYSSYEALPSRAYDWTEDHLPTSVHERVHLWANEKWVDYQKMQGKDIVDIGAPDEALRPAGVDPLGPSKYYDMEQSRVAGYSGYSQDPQPAWDPR
jgi:hypothetical protein